MPSLREILERQAAEKAASLAAAAPPVVHKPQATVLPPEIKRVTEDTRAVVPPASGLRSALSRLNQLPKETPAEIAMPPAEQRRSVLSRIAAETRAVPGEEPKPMVPYSAQPAQMVELPQAAPTLNPLGDFADFRKNLDYLASNIEHREIVGQVVRTILVQLRHNPQFSTMSQNFDGDVDLIVRGVRRSFQTQARKKVEKADSKRGSDVEADRLAMMLKDMGATVALGR